MDEIGKKALMNHSVQHLMVHHAIMQKAVQTYFLHLFLHWVLIYLILAAQFESFIDPFIIMLTVPLALRCSWVVVVQLKFANILVRLRYNAYWFGNWNLDCGPSPNQSNVKAKQLLKPAYAFTTYPDDQHC